MAASTASDAYELQVAPVCDADVRSARRCGVGMLTSVMWGVIVFGETPQEPRALLGALALVIGTGGVAAARATADDEPPRPTTAKAADDDAAELLEGGAPSPPPADGAARRRAGIALAVATGLLDGSLMAPFRACELSGGDPTSYLVSFGLALPFVSAPSLVEGPRGNRTRRFRGDGIAAVPRLRRVRPVLTLCRTGRGVAARESAAP